MNFAKGLMKLEMCPVIEGEGKEWKFLGIWSKNRWEWTVSLLACMHFKATVVGFYDAMGVEQVEYILNQTELTSIVCAGAYAEKIIKMKSEGMATHVRDLILMEGETISDEMRQNATSDLKIRIHNYNDVVE